MPLIYSRCFRERIVLLGGNKSFVRWFTLVCVAEERSSAVFEQLAMPLFDRLYNFAHWLTRNQDEAEDLVQETYVKALKGFSSFEPGTNFKAWIFRILRNTFLTSRTGLKAATVPLDLQDNDAALPVENETPETILIDRASERKAFVALQFGSRPNPKPQLKEAGVCA